MTKQQIIEIQQALNAQGWTVDDKPLEVDGLWGPATEAALIGFQEDAGLDMDGIPGPLTLAALLPTDDRDLKVGEVPVEYDFTTKAGTIEAIKTECKRQGLGLPAQIAYVLATVEWETGRTFKPVREAYWKSEDWRQANLRYWPYYGRGYVQLTWKANYQKYGRILNLPLADNPDLAMEPMTALRILVDGFKTGAFTGANLERYVNKGKTDFYNARRCINGLDRAEQIAEAAEGWLRKL